MYKNLTPQGIGVSGRQSELIEMALTYGFKGFDLDMREFARKVASRGREVASRYLQSAQIRLNFRVSCFELPVRWTDDEAVFKQDLDKLPQVAETAQVLGSRGCYTTIPYGSDKLNYHENFTFHQQRLGKVAEVLAKHRVRLGLGFLSNPKTRKEKKFEFIHQVDPFLTLVKTLGVSNLGVVVDLYHWHLGGGTVKQIRELNPEQIVQVRVSDADPEIDPVAATEENRLLPGKGGTIDAVGALHLLGEMEYDGPVSPFANSRIFAGLTRDRIVRLGGEALEGAWKEAGLNRQGRLGPEEEEQELVAVSAAAEEEIVIPGVNVEG